MVDNKTMKSVRILFLRIPGHIPPIELASSNIFNIFYSGYYLKLFNLIASPKDLTLLFTNNSNCSLGSNKISVLGEAYLKMKLWMQYTLMLLSFKAYFL